MARYRLKRKTFGALDMARNAVGGTVETAGDILDSGLGKTAGATLGAVYGPSLVSSGLNALGNSAGGFGGAMSKVGGFLNAGPLGMATGALLGWGAAKLGGKLLKKAGQGISAD